MVMEEVDKIIIHSLRQIGCQLNESFIMSNFMGEKELLINAVSICLRQIKPNVNLPRLLPDGGMAQHHSVASGLAELCVCCGYRNDIGYQTFLYPNASDVRRLFMFLIEQLPKDTRKLTDIHQSPIDDCDILLKEIQNKVVKYLKADWVPQYSRTVRNRRLDGCDSNSVMFFTPQHNLSVLNKECKSKEELSYMSQAPNVFHQTALEEYDLVSSVLHRNSLDLFSNINNEDSKKNSLEIGLKSFANNRNNPITNTHVANTKSVPTPLETLQQCINEIKNQNDLLLKERRAKCLKLNALKIQKCSEQEKIRHLQKHIKLSERSFIVLENPLVNVSKLDNLVQTTQERRYALEQKWQTYQQANLDNLKELQAVKNAKSMKNIMELRTTIFHLEQALHEKIAHHAQLSSDLRNTAHNAVSRHEYTKRILEFISNIRKQRNDIFKVLDDTRDLQKQLNSVSAQLQRQFNYTDDLLFQSAKHDLHSKKAYKLLASVHATCSELIELVSQTGNISKEIRDLEVHIDGEKGKNIAVNLKKILTDTRNFENVIKNVQMEIRKVENLITPG